MRKKQRARRSLSDQSEQSGVKMTTYYRSGENTDKPSPFVKKPRKKRYLNTFLKSVDTLAIAAIFLLIVYSLLLSTDPTVKTTSNSYRSNSVYKKAVAAELGHIKNRNKITFDEKSTVKALKRQFPEVTGVDIELPVFSHDPTFRLTIAKPSFILNSAGRLYVIGSSGRAVTTADGFSKLSELHVVNDRSGYSSVLGQQVMSKEGVVFLNTLLQQLDKSAIEVSDLTLPARAQELQMRTKDKNYYVKFFLGGDAVQQIGQYIATREDLERKGITPSEYLDVRVLGKVYYK